LYACNCFTALCRKQAVVVVDNHLFKVTPTTSLPAKMSAVKILILRNDQAAIETLWSRLEQFDSDCKPRIVSPALHDFVEKIPVDKETFL